MDDGVKLDQSPAGTSAAAVRGPRPLSWDRRWIAGAVALLAALILPFFSTEYMLHIMILICLFGYTGSAWNLLSGYTGQISFGHAIFFGLGAYTSTVLYNYHGVSPWFGMFAGASLAALVGLFIGYTTFRYGLRGAYFALAMFAFGEIFRLGATNFDYVRGPMGMYVPLRGDDPSVFQFSNRAVYYFVGLAMLLMIMYVAYRLERSKMGYYLIAIRENEEAATFLGINVTRYKIAAMALSAFFTAFGGTFYAQYFLFIDPVVVLGNPVSVDILLRPLIGGPGTVLGPIVGALLLTPLAEFTRSALRAYVGLPLVLYGMTLVVAILFLPNGILGLLQDWMAAARRRANRSHGGVEK